MPPQTSKPEYGPYLLASLRELGGDAPRDQVLSHLYGLMESMLHPADREILRGVVPRWMSEAGHMLDGLIEEGYAEEQGVRVRLTAKGLAYLEGGEKSS